MSSKDGTETSSFGTPGRINHDSSRFYNSRLYEGVEQDKKIEYVENRIPDQYLDQIFCKSSEDMVELPDSSVHLMITSPPYNVTKEYDEDLSLAEYLNLLRRVWRETRRVLAPGGRACINIANLGRKPAQLYHRNDAGIGLLDAGRDHLEQSRQRQPLHRLGELAVGRQSRVARYPRIYFGLLQRQF